MRKTNDKVSQHKQLRATKNASRLADKYRPSKFERQQMEIRRSILGSYATPR